MTWLIAPAEDKQPRTMTAYAAQHGMSVVTLYNWKKTPGFMVAVREVLYAEIHDAMPDVLREIVRRARIGEVQFVDRYLSLVGGSDIVAGANARRIDNTMSDDDAARILQRAIPALATTRATIIEQGTESDTTIVMDETN
jgi:TRAP-type mannitol/chloroaromatic compound transport system permease large subunit